MMVIDNEMTQCSYFRG